MDPAKKAKVDRIAREKNRSAQNYLIWQYGWIDFLHDMQARIVDHKLDKRQECLRFVLEVAIPDDSIFVYCSYHQRNHDVTLFRLGEVFRNVESSEVWLLSDFHRCHRLREDRAGDRKYCEAIIDGCDTSEWIKFKPVVRDIKWDGDMPKPAKK